MPVHCRNACNRLWHFDPDYAKRTDSMHAATHFQIIEGLIDRLIALGKPFDYMVYPHRDHSLHEGDGTLVHVRMLILRYWMQNLPPGLSQ